LTQVGSDTPNRISMDGNTINIQKNSRLNSERCGLVAFLSGSLLHIYEKQTTWRYNGYRRVYDVDFAIFFLWKVNVYPILCL